MNRYIKNLSESLLAITNQSIVDFILSLKGQEYQIEGKTTDNIITYYSDEEVETVLSHIAYCLHRFGFGGESNEDLYQFGVRSDFRNDESFKNIVSIFEGGNYWLLTHAYNHLIYKQVKGYHYLTDLYHLLLLEVWRFFFSHISKQDVFVECAVCQKLFDELSADLIIKSFDERFLIREFKDMYRGEDCDEYWTMQFDDVVDIMETYYIFLSDAAQSYVQKRIVFFKNLKEKLKDELIKEEKRDDRRWEREKNKIVREVAGSITNSRGRETRRKIFYTPMGG